MPRINLKPNSPHFADGGKPEKQPHRCDMPGCAQAGEFKAPKDRGLNQYYYFCLPHVQEYNKAWDYFSGMSPADIEEQIFKANIWDRPTRRFDNFENLEETLRRKSGDFRAAGDEPPKEKARKPAAANTPEFEAMAIMGLEPPLSLPAIKARYKSLVKKHHPDVNGGDKEAEELLKSINMAYTILKAAYEKYEVIKDK
jgi:curved DNA-binding protein CbpA